MVVHRQFCSWCGWYLGYGICGNLLVLRFYLPLCPHLVDSCRFLMRSCTEFLRAGSLKSSFILGDLGGSLLALLVGVNLTLIGLFRVILTGDFRDWHIPYSINRAFYPSLRLSLCSVLQCLVPIHRTRSRTRYCIVAQLTIVSA